jgi:predicted dehydrogenase
LSELAVGLAGAGYWGSKLARNIDEARGCSLAAVSDPEPERVASVRHRAPLSRAYADIEELVADDALDAVVLATPASLHAEHARLALRAGKHVLVEKPLALSSADCDELCRLAASSNLTLMVGHTFIYSEPVRLLRALIQSGELGRVLYVYAQRLNLGIVREDLNALWNFGPHDVSILLYLLGSLPERVSAQQYSLLNRHLEDVVFLVLEFDDGVVAHVHESWLDPRKVRELTVVGDRKMAVYDDTDVEAPVRIYDKGVVPEPFPAEPAAFDTGERGFGEFKLTVRAGDMLAPHIVPREPLRTEIEHFVECVATGASPLTGGRHGREVVAVLEAADRSTRNGGAATPVVEAASPAGL